jgi:hypothetical protein
MCRLAIFAAASPGPVRRQSRVEIYEAERRIQKKGSTATNTTPTAVTTSSKFSLRNLFKSQQQLQSNSHSSSHRSDSPGDSSSIVVQLLSPNKFIDKEHEREILERQGKGRPRPEIIHPLDLQNGGVEVVKITPKAHALKSPVVAPPTVPFLTGDRKNAALLVTGGVETTTNSGGGGGMANKLVVRLGDNEDEGIENTIVTAMDMTDNNKDSGHDSSSIQTEMSEEMNGGEYFSVAATAGGYAGVRSMPQVTSFVPHLRNGVCIFFTCSRCGKGTIIFLAFLIENKKVNYL